MSYRRYLRSRYRAILAYMGVIWSLIGLLTLAPLLGLLAFPGERALASGFLIPGLSLLAIGLGLALTLHPEQAPALSLREGSVIIVLSWIPAFLVGLVPFMLIEDLSFVQALFEATSGWTTTGLSVIDVTAASRLTLLYRSMMQLAGGAGFVIVMMTFILGPAGSGLSAAEGRADQLAPHVRRSALLVLRIYAAYILLGVLALWLAGMDWFDAVIHAFSGVSTGGFSTRPDSIAYWDSPMVEGVIMALMLLGSTNFLTIHTLLSGKVRAAIKNSESRLMLVAWPVSALVVLFGVGIGVYPNLGRAARAAVFETLSALSGTGYTIVDYSIWGGLGWLVIMILMTIGGGTNSTAGGMKQFRIYVLLRTALLEFKRLFLPKRTVVQPSAWVGERHVFLSDEDLRRINVFFLVYLSTLILGALIISSYGYSLADSLFEIASTVGTVGLSVGVTSAQAPPGLLLTQVLGMFLGRLEYFTVVGGLVKLATDLRKLIS